MNGISHSWNGTVLTITSDSGTSSCDLKGEKGDDGVRGAQGAAGVAVNIDKTLSLSGSAADAKETGDKITALQPIAQCVSGSTKPITSGAAYDLKTQINTLNTDVSKAHKASTISSNYTTLLDWCVDNPHASAMYSGLGLEDCPIGTNYGNVVTFSPRSDSGITVLVSRNYDNTMYFRKITYTGKWAGDSWINLDQLRKDIDTLNTNMSTALKRTVYEGTTTVSTHAMTEGRAYIVHLNAVGSANAKYTAWLGIAYCNKADGTESGVQAWIENQKGGSYVQTNGKNIEMYCSWGYVATVIQINK